jgi:hypothetical protein
MANAEMVLGSQHAVRQCTLPRGLLLIYSCMIWNRSHNQIAAGKSLGNNEHAYCRNRKLRTDTKLTKLKTKQLEALTLPIKKLASTQTRNSAPATSSKKIDHKPSL